MMLLNNSTTGNSNTNEPNTMIGIITRKDDEHVFVWNSRFPMNEIKFLRWGTKTFFQTGDAVRFKIMGDPNEVQSSANIEKEAKSKMEVVFTDNCSSSFTVKSHLSFPPENEGYYERELSATKNLGCLAIAFSVEFGKVALFSDKITYEPMKLYYGFVTRIPKQKDWIAEKLGTLFIISDHTPLEEIAGKIELEQSRLAMPWKKRYVSSTISNDQIPTLHRESAAIMPSISQQNQSTSAEAEENTMWLDERAESTNGEDILLDLNGSLNVSSQQQNSSLPPQREQSVLAAESSSSNQMDRGGMSEENRRFGQLLASKLQWVQQRNPMAAKCLQKRILDTCFHCEFAIGTEERQQQ